MSKTVKVPDPVYQRLSRESDRKDVSRGAIVREWMTKADRFDDIDAEHHQ